MGLGSADAALMEADGAYAFENIRKELLAEYRQDHQYPWIVGYSGGKDSTLVAHFVFEMLMGLPPSDRKRAVHIVANDTLVEGRLAGAERRPDA